MKSKKEKRDEGIAKVTILEELDPTQIKAIVFQGPDIQFKESVQSAVKSLKVTITSTEALDQKAISILHKLHTQIRTS